MDDVLINAGLIVLVASFGIMHIAHLEMIRFVNRNPGREGRIPLYSVLLKTTFLYYPTERYLGIKGKDFIYKTLRIARLAFAIGLVSAIGGASVKLFSNR